MDELKEIFAEWSNFVEERELAREKAQNPDGAQELREQIDQAKADVLKAKAHLQMLQAQLVLNNDGAPRYNKSTFDYQWARKKNELKRELHKVIAEHIEAGVGIPSMMKALGTKNSVLFYSVKENLNMYREAAKEEAADTEWQWSDATSVHRYALATEPGKSKFAFVLLKGALDTEFEGDQCMFAFDTGYFISGNRALFDSVTPSVKKQRSHLLADILTGVYSKTIKRDTNPYFTN